MFAELESLLLAAAASRAAAEGRGGKAGRKRNLHALAKTRHSNAIPGLVSMCRCAAAAASGLRRGKRRRYDRRFIRRSR